MINKQAGENSWDFQEERGIMGYVGESERHRLVYKIQGKLDVHYGKEEMSHEEEHKLI